MLFQEVCPHCQITLINEEACSQCGWQRSILPAETGTVVQAISWPEATFVRAGGTPQSGRSHAYLPALNGDLFALKPGTSTPIIWHYRLPPHTYAPGVAEWGDYVLAGTVYVGGLPAPACNLILLQAQTGREVRQFNLNGSTCSTPLISDGVAYTLDNRSWLYAIDLTTLKEIYQRQLPTWAWGPTAPCLTPDNLLILNGRSNRLQAWDLTNHQIVWQFKGGGWFTKTPLWVDEFLYAHCWDNYLYALNWRTGEKVWACHAPDGFSSTACISGDFIHIGSNEGNNRAALWVINRHTGEIVNRYAVAGRIYGRPLVLGDTIYFGTDVHATEGEPRGYIYRLKVETGLDAPILASPHPFQTNLIVSEDLVIGATKYGLVYFIQGEKKQLTDQQGNITPPLTPHKVPHTATSEMNASATSTKFIDQATDYWQRGDFLQAATFYDLAGEPESALAAYKRLSPLTFTPALREFIAELAISLEDWLYAAQLYADLGNARKVAALAKTVCPT